MELVDMGLALQLIAMIGKKQRNTEKLSSTGL